MKKSNFEKIKAILFHRLLEIAIILGSLIFDLVSKAIIAANMDYGQTIVVIPKFLNFSYTINKKAAFGNAFGLDKVFGEKGTLIFFIILTVLAVGFFAYLLFKDRKKGMLYRIAFSLIIGGALGNLYDRIFLSGVRDFIQIEYFGLELFGQTTFAIFNIADSCVVVGTILLLIYLIFFDKTFKEESTKKSESGEQQTETCSNNSETEGVPEEIRESVDIDVPENDTDNT